MIEWRVTFGQIYARESHPRLPEAHPDGWLTVIAPADVDDPELAARVAVIARIGRGWSCIYHPADDGYPTTDGYYPRGELARITANP